MATIPTFNVHKTYTLLDWHMQFIVECITQILDFVNSVFQNRYVIDMKFKKFKISKNIIIVKHYFVRACK